MIDMGVVYVFFCLSVFVAACCFRLVGEVGASEGERAGETSGAKVVLELENVFVAVQVREITRIAK